MKAGEMNLDSTGLCDRRTRLAPDNFDFLYAAMATQGGGGTWAAAFLMAF